MSNEVETVDIDYENIEKIDSTYAKQKEGVAKMRASLLACDVYGGDGTSTLLQTMNNLTVMRVYHQLMRIIRYTEMMDKLEDKLYKSIDEVLDSSNTDPGTLLVLLKIQADLQKSMIESHKLLQPYMDAKDFKVSDLITSTAEVEVSPKVSLMSQAQRENLRNSAGEVLKALQLRTGTEG